MRERRLGSWPPVCVQLPVYNEPAVAERLVRAAAGLRYPGRLRIQVLDDSTDQTVQIISRTISELDVDEGVLVEHIRREDRSGYKAGALSHGFDLSSEEFIAVFDADFVPCPDFLTEVIPHFSGPAVGMVQCRWDHLNRNESLLTRLQALYLDAHFSVESRARFQAGVFFNFNGTAGVWRRQAIADAGGWSAETVTEDLDLSYRAQLAGWKFLFLDDVTVPAELPSSLAAFHGQQHRWAKGSIQTARRQLPRLLRSPLSAATRVEALFHLTNNWAYLLTLILALLIVPSALIRYSIGLTPLFMVDLILFGVCTGSLVRFYREGQRRIGRRPPPLWELIALVPFGVGLSFVNSAAVIEGAVRRAGIFNRTPKSGGRKRIVISAAPRFPVPEALLSIWLSVAFALMVAMEVYVAAPFLLLFIFGFGSTTVIAIAEWIDWSRSLRIAHQT